MISLFHKYPTLKEKIPHLSLGDFPTPIERAEILGKELGIPNLYFKRDDISGNAYGGNKVRKLEFLLADAKAKGAGEVMTFGCVGSNHALATAVYCRELGIHPILILLPQPKTKLARKNLLMDLAQEAEFHFAATIEEASQKIRDVLKQHEMIRGKAPLVIPAGGSSHLGAVGFVNAAYELKEQIEKGDIPEPDVIYVAMGTMATSVGLILGLKSLSLKTQVIPVRVTDERFATRGGMIKLFYETNTFLHAMDHSFPVLEFPKQDGIRDEFLGEEYASYTQEGVNAVKLARKTEGIVLEGTYTGKAMACLIADAASGNLRTKNVLFWNTYNSRQFDELIGKMDYHELPSELHPFFQEDLQPLDR